MHYYDIEFTAIMLQAQLLAITVHMHSTSNFIHAFKTHVSPLEYILYAPPPVEVYSTLRPLLKYTLRSAPC